MRSLAAVIDLLEIAQKLAATPDHHQQTAAAGMIFLMSIGVGELVDPLGEDGDLHLANRCHLRVCDSYDQLFFVCCVIVTMDGSPSCALAL